MLSKLKEVQDALADFVHQNRYQALVIRATDVELIYLLKMVEGLDQREAAHVFGLFPQPVAGGAPAYVTTVLAGLRAQLEPINQLRIAEGNPPWPPLPAECDDPRTRPGRRLRAGIAHAARLIPGGMEHRMAFCLLPQAIGKPAAWAEALTGVLPSEGGGADEEAAWPRVRLLVRDDAAAPILIPALRRAKNPQVLIYEPDLSPAALMDAMAREVADPGLPEANRMQMLAELAALDYAYGRLTEAVAKYEILYDYYHRNQAQLMEAMVLQGVGDVLRRIGKLPLARERFGQGLTLAITTKGLPLIMSLAFSAGDTSLELQRFKDAEDHLEIARKVASKLFNHPVEADALEKIGDARLAQKLPGEAMAAWRDAANICRKAAYRDRLASVLEKMSKTFASARMSADQRACDQELAAVRAGAPIKAPVV
jgi:tetratricopeptide (TPR) repeat protein